MKLLKFLILALIFLLPLFWLPFSFEIFEFNKFYLLFFGSWFLILIWLLKQILKDKEIRFYWNKFDFLVLIFVLIAILSFFFSKDKISGLFGTYGRTNDGILTLLSFFALYVLVRNNLAVGEIKISEIFNSLFFASFVALLWTITQMIFSTIGFLQRVPFLRKYFVFSPVSAFFSAVAVFFSLIFIWVLTQLLTAKETKIKKVFYVIFIVLTFLLLLIFDFTSAWILLVIGLIFFVFLSLKDRIFREDVRKLFLPLLFLFFAVIFSFLNVRSLIFNLTGKTLLPDISQEMILTHRESRHVALRSVTSGIKNLFLGSGPATFSENFTKFRPDSFKKGNLWQIRFNMAGNYFAEILVFFGLSGAAIFFVILLWLLALVVFKKGTTEKIPLKNFLLVSILLPIFTFQNMVLASIFWLSLAIGANFISAKEKRYPIQNFPEITLIFETITVILILLFIPCLFLGIWFYFPDYYYQKGFLEPDLDKKIEYFKKSIGDFQKAESNYSRHHPYYQIYQMALSQALILRVQAEIPKENQNPELIQTYSFLALDLAEKTTEKAPNNLIYIENLANVYRDLINLVQDADEWAIKNYEKANSLDSKNPLYLVEIGKILRSKNKLSESREKLQKALELDPDLTQAKIQLSLILEQEGKRKEAISEMEKLTSSELKKADRGGLPNYESFFYLGILYYNEKEIDKAINNFQIAISLFPAHSNSRFFLALCFEEKGDLQKALEHLKYVERINPEHAILKQKIKEIEEKMNKRQSEEQKESDLPEREEMFLGE